MISNRMIRNCALAGLFALACAALAACKAVMADSPVGSEPVALEAREWNGVWRLGESLLVTRVRDAQAGRIECGIIEADSEPISLTTATLIVRRHRDATFANFQDRGTSDTWTWGRIKRLEGGDFIIWAPNPDMITMLIEQGQLNGEAKDDKVMLRELTPAHMDLISTDSQPTLYFWTDPLVARRVDPH